MIQNQGEKHGASNNEKLAFSQKIICFILMAMGFSLSFDGYTVLRIGSIFRLLGLLVVCFLPLVLIISHKAQKTFLTRLHATPLIALLLFLLWSGITILWAPNTNWALTRFASYLGLLGVVLCFLTLPSSAVAKIWISVLMGIAVSLPLGFVLPHPNPLLQTAGRFSSGGKDPNEYANLVLIAFLASYFGAVPYVKKKWKLWLSCLGWLSILAVPLSGSRTALVNAFITLSLGTSRRGWRGFKVASLAISALMMSFFLLPLSTEHLIQRIHSLRALTVEITWVGRWDIWRAAWKVFIERPLGGIGLNNFAWVSPEYSQVAAYIASLREDKGGGSAHNSFLSVLAETGLIGLLFFLFLQISMFIHLWRKRYLEPLTWGLMLGFLGYWIASLTLTWEPAKIAFFLYGSALAVGKKGAYHAK